MVLTIISRGRKNDERKQTIPQTVLLAWEQNVGTERGNRTQVELLVRTRRFTPEIGRNTA